MIDYLKNYCCGLAIIFLGIGLKCLKPRKTIPPTSSPGLFSLKLSLLNYCYGLDISVFRGCYLLYYDHDLVGLMHNLQIPILICYGDLQAPLTMEIKPSVALRAMLVGSIAACAKIAGVLKAAGGAKIGVAATAMTAAATAAMSSKQEDASKQPSK